MNQENKPTKISTISLDPDAMLRDRLSEIVNKGLDFADKISKEKGLDFHDIEHTKKVVERYRYIIQTLNYLDIHIGNNREVMLGEVGAAFHDVVQDFEEERKEENYNSTKFIKIRRKRKVGSEAGGNEYESAEVAIKFLHEKLADFSDDDASTIREQILVTVPEFRQNEGVVQVNLNEQSSVTARALAMADLGTSGMEPENFVVDSDKLFREDNIDIMRAIGAMNEGGWISDEQQAYFKSRMLAWCKIQIDFPEERKNKINKELDAILEFKIDPQRKEVFIQRVFPGFDNAKNNMQKAYNTRKEMNFLTLASIMGYKVHSQPKIKIVYDNETVARRSNT